MRQEYSIISERDGHEKIKHSYAGKVNTNANTEEPIMKPFEECSDALIYRQIHKEHENLLIDPRLKISKIETKISEYIK